MNEPPRLKVATVLASRGRGGLELHYVQLCNHLTEYVDVAAIAHPEFVPQLDPGVHCLPLDVTRSRRNPLLLLQLLRHLRSEPFDIIHAHANKAVELVSTLRRFLQPQLVGTLHNQKPTIRMFHRMHHVIAVSRRVAELVHHPTSTVIYNGLPTTKVSKVDLRVMFQLPADRPVIVAVGRLVSAKCFDVLIDAVAPLEVVLLIAGDGPDERYLRRRVRRHNAHQHIRLLGHRKDVTALLRSADGVIVSSRKEGFSYVTAEALLLGARLLSTDVPVANEVLPPELIVPADDPVALRERLRELLASPDEWDRLLAPAHAFASEHFTIDCMVRRTVEVYRTLAHTRPRIPTNIAT